jgi:quinol monooxygenase YgiN
LNIGIIIEHHVKEGLRDAARATWEEFLRPAIEANPGHLSYAYMYDLDDPT